MIPLMISEKERNEIKELIEAASKDYTPLEKMMSLKQQSKKNAPL